MTRKFTAILAAFALAFTALTPTAASARDHRGGWDGHRGGGYYDRGYRHHRDNDGDAVAAGAIGLVLGLALGAAAASPPRSTYYNNGYNNCYRCSPPPPPPRYYNNGGYYNQGYAPPPPQYYDDGGYYDDGYRQSQCTRRERQYDRYARQYVTVDVPC